MATTALARDVLPDDLPYQTGAAGPLGSSAAALLLRECDTLLLVGAEDLDPAVLADPAGCRIVAVGSGESVPGTAVRVNGDPRAALEALILMLHRATDRGWRTRVEAMVREWRAEGAREGQPVLRHLGEPPLGRRRAVRTAARPGRGGHRLRDRARTCHPRLRNGMRSLLSGHLGLPGAAVPYAVAAKFAAPERPVIALVGDGALQGGGLNELITVRRHLDRLAALPPLVFRMLNNGDLNRLTRRRRAVAGDPLLPLSAEVPAMPYAEWARLAGLPAVRCDRPRHVASVRADVPTQPGPVLLEFVVDGEIPPDWAAADGGRERPGKKLLPRA